MISIIIPTFNHGKKIGHTLDSILKQSIIKDLKQLNSLEVIIVNDGSRDNTEDVVNSYKTNFSAESLNISYISQDNKGAPAARNAGYKIAKGDYLFFCDADAILKENALSKLLNALNNNLNSSYAYSSFMWGNKLFKLEKFSEERLKKAPFIHTMSLIRNEAMPIGGWDESITKLQDWDLYLTMLDNGQKGVFVDEVLFTVSPGGNISSWLPSFAYKLLPFLPNVKKYKKAVEVVKNKHNLL